MEKKIIEFVRNNPMIYDKGHNGYKNLKAKEKKWAAFSEQLKVPADTLKKRWKTLRDRFLRQRKKEQLAPSGSGQRSSSEEPSQKYKYYNLLRFLCDKNKRTSGNYDCAASCYQGFIAELEQADPIELLQEVTPENLPSESMNTSVSSASRVSTPEGSCQSSKRRRKLREQNIHKQMTELITAFQANVERQTPAKLFFESIAMQVENANLNPSRFASLQMKVVKALQEEIELQKQETLSTSHINDVI